MKLVTQYIAVFLFSNSTVYFSFKSCIKTIASPEGVYLSQLYPYIYNGNIFPSLNPANIFQFISLWTESTKSPAFGPNHMRSN